MRFLADMGVSTRTVDWLRRQDHDVVHLREIGWQRATDAEIIIKAASESRVVLTMDLDFGYLLALSHERAPSVVLLRLSDQRSESVNRRLAHVLDSCAEVLESGAVVSVRDDALRVRQLPL